MKLTIELFGGPHDGFLVECKITPPTFIFVPLDAVDNNEAAIYTFEPASLAANQRKLRYSFVGYRPISAKDIDEIQDLTSSFGESFR